MTRWALFACCPVLLAVEVYRRGYVAPLLFGCRQWGRVTWRTELDPVG